MTEIAAACVAFCGASAFAAVTPSCNITTSAVNSAYNNVALVKNCTPEVTFYAAGATALKGAIQTVMTTDGKIFNMAKPFASIARKGDSNTYAYYGFGAAGTTWVDKKVLVIVNGTNGSMAGVNQLLTGLKQGSVENGVQMNEFITFKLHTAADQKAGKTMVDADFDVFDDKKTPFSVPKDHVPTVTLAAARVEDFKKAWGGDKQKVAHMAFSDVRPSEATPGQIAKWAPASFPADIIAMQGFGVLVNTNMYKALQARDIAAKRMSSTCQDDMLTAACQPNISTADYTALMTGKVIAAADLGLTGALTLHRRPASSGTQAATQIRFAGQANYMGKVPLAQGFDMAGHEITNTAGVAVGDITVKTHSGTADLIKEIYLDTTGLSIGVASLDNSATKLGAASVARDNGQTAFWVKLDGVSPDFTGASDTALDSKYRTALKNGYSFAFEFVTLKSAKLAAPYADIYTKIVDGLKDATVDNNKGLTGIAYIGSTTYPANNTTWTRGGNNNFPLNKY